MKALALIFMPVMLAVPAAAMSGLTSDICWFHSSLVKDAAILSDREIAPTEAEAQLIKAIRRHFMVAQMSYLDLEH
jgi:hypothetical protein